MQKLVKYFLLKIKGELWIFWFRTFSIFLPALNIIRSTLKISMNRKLLIFLMVLLLEKNIGTHTLLFRIYVKLFMIFLFHVFHHQLLEFKN